MGLLSVSLFFVRLHSDQRRGEPHAGHGPLVGPSAQLAGGAKVSKSHKTIGPSAQAVGWVVGGVALFLISGAAIVLLRRRREPDPGEPESSPATSPIDDSFNDIRALADPRAAVIAAYARMEQLLARQGCIRAHAEAPREFLARCRIDVEADVRPIEQLTKLYELAKFSRRRMAGAAKTQALEALMELRDSFGHSTDATTAPHAAQVAATTVS